MRYLLAACMLTACAPGPRPTLDLTIDGAAVAGCAFFTRHGEIVHLWLAPARGSAIQQLELGLALRGAAPLVVPLWPNDELAIEGWLPRWRREGGGYGIAFSPPDTLWMVDSGRVVLERVTDEQLVGTVEASARRQPRGLRDTTVVWRRFRGRFVAPRDRAYERFAYRSAAEFTMPAPRHVCDRDRPT